MYIHFSFYNGADRFFESSFTAIRKSKSWICNTLFLQLLFAVGEGVFHL